MRKKPGVLLPAVLVLAALACNLGTPIPPVIPTPNPPLETTMPPAGETPPGMGTAAPPAHTYAVILVPEGGTLNAYTTAGAGSPAVGSLSWNAVDLHSTGHVETAGAGVGVEVEMPGGGTGWVDRQYLTEYVPSAEFCADTRVAALFSSFLDALYNNDGRLLIPIVSPVHGLTVTYIHNGNPRVYSPSNVDAVFGSNEVVDWGLGPGSGMPVQGMFRELVRPDLIAVFGASYETHCNAITLGGASYIVTWPSQWKNINFYSVYKPGTPGTEMDWMTWLTGVEYVDGNPYLFSLSRYNWEP